MGRPMDLTGDRYGRLTVIELAKVDSRGRRFWLCKCDCGNEKIASSVNLRGGCTVSCGCRRKETLEEFKQIVTKHGKRYSGVYGSWRAMKRRCNDKKYPQYYNYGGRGITYSTEWESFENFYKDMGDRPEGMTLDRIDNDKSYSKENCRWATKEEQMNNTRCSTHIEYHGETKSITEWSKELGMDRHTFEYRLKTWPIEKVFTKPVRNCGRNHNKGGIAV